ncbi:Nup154 [Trypoxylus dichotomus]
MPDGASTKFKSYDFVTLVMDGHNLRQKSLSSLKLNLNIPVRIVDANLFKMNQTLDLTRNTTYSSDLVSQQIEKCLARDNAAPTLVELMNISPQNVATASGLTDHDYPALSTPGLNAQNLTQIKTLSKVPLPPEIMEHFGHMQCHCMMGLFTDINRAWLTIDSDIYLWTYEEGGDVAYFDGLNDTIISVGLILPKPGVFHTFIKHLLVLTTAVDIVVLGVTFNGTPDDPLAEIQLVADPVFTIPTDGTTITCIIGSQLGRLFLGTKCGSLYEIAYQAESSWFGKRFKKINHSTSTLSFLLPSFLNAALVEEEGIAQISIDNSRHMLYALSDKGSIEMYDMSQDGKSFSRVYKLSQKSLVQQAMNTVKTLDSQNFRPIVSISAVELSESSQVYLVATTQTGIRFYLTGVGISNTQPGIRPYTLTLLHVRLPPGYSATLITRPRNVHMAHYRNKNLILVSNINDKDLLWCISSDLFPFSSVLMEAHTSVALDGPALAMAEVRHPLPFSKHKSMPDPPCVVSQHVVPPRKYVVLTTHGAHIFLKFRPVDLLRQLLVDSRGQDTDAVKNFFALQQCDQACATNLILACLDDPQNSEVSEYATRAFFLYGGEPKVVPAFQGTQTNLLSGASVFNPNVVSTPLASQQNYQYQTQSPNQSLSFAQSPLQQTSPISPLSQMQTLDPILPLQYSSKHNGLYIYLERILRPIWHLLCVDKTVTAAKKIFFVSTVTSTDCVLMLAHLNALRLFFYKNTQLSIGINNSTIGKPAYTIIDQTNTNMTNYTLQDAQMEEKHSLDAFKVFINHCCQVIGLWKILCEHQFHMLIDELHDSQKQILQNTTFKDLLLYGKDLCSLLITKLIGSYLGDNASVDSISIKLRDICPDLYKVEDAAYSKANEILKSAKTLQNIDEREELIRSALELCCTVAPNINLFEICQQFTVLKAYHAVIELCALCAKKIDPENVALHYYKKNEIGDREGYQFYSKRMDIYKNVLNMLDSFQVPQDNQTTSNQSANNSLPGVNKQNENNILTRNVIDNILQYSDELLHVAVYEWMIAKNMSGDIIKIKNTSLETFLIKASHESTDAITILDLLWKYYESNNNHASAAKVLNNLASQTGNTLTLQDRLAYLARSIMCMRSDKIGYAPYLGVFLRELEDKIDIAKVQEQILEAIKALQESHPNAEDAINALNSGLYEITQLYENFAEPFKLWECKLAIIDCAGYSDGKLVETIWRNILHDEVRKSNGTGDDKMTQILSKVRALSRVYKFLSNCFPLGFIVKELENISAKLRADVTLVPKFLISIEIPTETLISAYNELMVISATDRFWSSEAHEFHFFEVLIVVIRSFVEMHELYSNVEKRRLIALCQDTIASLLSNLYSKANTNDLINTLRDSGDESEHELFYYANDRIRLMKEVLKLIKPKKIKAIAPDFMKSLDIDEVNSILLEELLGISNKRLKHILNGENVDIVSTSSESEHEQPPIDVISLDDISDTDDEFGLGSVNTTDGNINKDTNNKTKSHKDKKKIKEIKEEKKHSSTEKVNNENDKLMNVLEILELQARARAIRSQLALETMNKKSETVERIETIEDDDDDTAVIVKVVRRKKDQMEKIRIKRLVTA